MSAVWVRVVLIIIGAALGSGGFWSYLQFRSIRGTATTRLMMGMAYREITTLGLTYIQRGYITMDELEDFRKYFFEPYEALGGNGVAKRVMGQVETLPFRSHNENPNIFTNGRGRTFPNVSINAGTGGNNNAP